jgi:uncharacterized protein (DUF1778 family)
MVRMQRQQLSRNEQRLEARVTPEQKRLNERAATLRGTAVTEFGLEALRKRCRTMPSSAT